MEASATSGAIILNFGWKGPNSWSEGSNKGNIRVVDLVFKNAKTHTLVNIPNNMSSTSVQKLPFTRQRFNETESNGQKFKSLAQETHPDLLKVTVEQIHNLTLKVGIFKNSSDVRSDREVKLEVPENLEIDQTYTLLMTSNGTSSIQARLFKEEQTNSNTTKEEKKVINEEFRRRLGNMGAALISEGMANLNLVAQGGGGVFDSSSTDADVYAHGMQGIIRSGQQMNSEIEVPYTKPAESLSDLKKLTVPELQSRFEATYKKDKEFESQRIKAAMSGDIQGMNNVIALEHANSQLLINLAQALESKGVKPKTPQSDSFKSASKQSQKDHEKMAKGLQEQCRQQ